MKLCDIRFRGIAIEGVDANAARAGASSLRIRRIRHVLTVHAVPIADLGNGLARIAVEVGVDGLNEAEAVEDLTLGRIVQHQETTEFGLEYLGLRSVIINSK